MEAPVDWKLEPPEFVQTDMMRKIDGWQPGSEEPTQLENAAKEECKAFVRSTPKYGLCWSDRSKYSSSTSVICRRSSLNSCLAFEFLDSTLGRN